MAAGTAPAAADIVLELKGITKRFPGVVANDGVDLAVRAGEIHALVGENGAGKSTLMKIAAGLYPPDAGEIRVRGRACRFRSAIDAARLGIGMVHQHFMLIPRLTVAENVVLGSERAPLGLLSPGGIARRVADLARQAGFAVDPRVPVAELSIGQQQRVEILKVLYRGADILILDEPTAVLAPQEVDEFFANLRRLKAQGKTIIFISHKLGEVLAIADRITVLRRGRVVGQLAAAEADRARLAEMIVGRPVLFDLQRPPARPGAPLLELERVSARGRGGLAALQDVSLTVRAGEIYGVAGIEGNGQAELAEVAVGLRRIAAGRVRVAGAEIRGGVAEFRRAGVAFVPEDRRRHGLVAPMTLWENLLLGRHRDPALRRGPGFDAEAVGRRARDLMSRFDVRAPGPDTAAQALSGGNQQRLVLARELSGDPRVVVASQPTRGLDIAATEFVWKQLLAARAQGKAVLLISADLEEILTLSDRIGVMYGGRLVAEFAADAATPEALGRHMTGGRAA